MSKDEKAKPNFYTLREVAKLLGISSATAVRWMKEDRFIGAERVGGQWIFRADFQVKEAGRGLRKELLKRLA